jgi:hypothetical protein
VTRSRKEVGNISNQDLRFYLFYFVFQTAIRRKVEFECMKLLEEGSSSSLEEKEFVLEILRNVKNAAGRERRSKEDDEVKEVSRGGDEGDHHNQVYLTPTEFSSFLYNLLSSESSSSSTSVPSVVSVTSGVSHLIRNKLRTPLGKPQELFGGLGNILRKRGACPQWKLQFMYQLEKAFRRLMEGGTIKGGLLGLGDNGGLLESAVQSFFVTNKGPCMEWLKRIRGDLMERGLENGDWAFAFYNAAMGSNRGKAAQSLFELHGE